jgi:hypothetical protein
MRVAISGASGLIGTALARELEAGGHEPVKLVRRESRGPREISWDPAKEEVGSLADIGAIVNLAGENIGAGRWTDARKREILESRVRGTRALARAIDERVVFVSASAVGYYGDGAEPVDEASPKGTGFLAEVSAAWEEAASPARERGARVVHPRFGLVLAAHGGALERMLLPFRMGAGGRLGSGEQWMSWITLDDTVRALVWCIERETAAGPVNVVAPNPVTNKDFTRALGKALHRPTFLPTPKFALKTLLGGELADELLLSGQRVVPHKLQAGGFEWRDPDLDAAFARLLR